MQRDWIELLRAALADEFGDGKPHICTLATVDEDGNPDARSVVCRWIDEAGRLYFASDARSEKGRQLRRCPAAAAVFWLPRRREQFRLRGKPVEILDATPNPPLRQQIWQDLSPASRALFAWPPPGAERGENESAFPRELDAATPIAPTFAVLSFYADEVQHLDLNPHPHERTVWQGGTRRRVNP